MEKLELQNKYETLKNVLLNRESHEDSHLKNIVRKLHSALLADFTFVGKLNDNKGVDTIALFHDGAFLDNFTYELKHTPCETAAAKGVAISTNNITDSYPNAQLLKDLGIEAYAGIALYDINNNVIGVLASMFKKPIADKELTELFLQMFAPQASSEVERL